MAKTAITVRSQHEGDAVKLALDHPGSRATAIIVGTLLPMTALQRMRVLRAVHASLDVTMDDGPVVKHNDDEPGERLRLLDGSGVSGTGE